MALLCLGYLFTNHSASRANSPLGPPAGPQDSAASAAAVRATLPVVATDVVASRHDVEVPGEALEGEAGSNTTLEQADPNLPVLDDSLLARIERLKELKGQLKVLQGDLLDAKFESGDYLVVDELSGGILSDTEGRPLPNAVQFRDDGLRVAILDHDEYPDVCELYWAINDLKKEIKALTEGD